MVFSPVPRFMKAPRGVVFAAAALRTRAPSRRRSLMRCSERWLATTDPQPGLTRLMPRAIFRAASDRAPALAQSPGTAPARERAEPGPEQNLHRAI